MGLKHKAFAHAGSTTGLRQALLIGFANRLARRMTTHNGYKTLSEPSTLAQLHPSTARITADEDGLLPEWVIYHELVSTARVFLNRVSFLELSMSGVVSVHEGEPNSYLPNKASCFACCITTRVHTW